MKYRLILQQGPSPSMEGKTIKEEILGSPSAASPENLSTNNVSANSNSPLGKENRRLLPSPLNTEILTRSRSKGATKEHSHHHRMSDSPKMVGIGSHAPGGSTPQHSPTVVTATVTKGYHGNKSYSQNFTSPHSTTLATNGVPPSAGPRITSPTPSPTGSTNGNLSGGRTPSTGSTSNSGSANSKSDPLGSSTSRLIVKIKRFLGTLLHFGCDISPEVGDRVRSLVFNLVSGHLTIEDFHHSLQEVTSFPLRPFVIPFLKAHLPLLQREISHMARISKQSPLSFVRTHEQVIVESGSSPGEPCDIFHSEAGEALGLIANGKRKSESLYENGDGGNEAYNSTPKRFNSGGLFSPPFFLSTLGPTPASATTPDLRDYYSSAMGYHLLASQFHSLPTEAQPPSAHPSSTSTPLPSNSNGAPPPPKGGPEEEWRNIHVMLNCILSMVDKTKRALSILQTRTFHNESLESGGSSGSTGATSWLRRPAGGFGPLDTSDEFKREVMAQALRVAEDRVSEVKRRTEDVVQEVKRQAAAEVQRAVAAVQARFFEEFQRAKLQRTVLDLRRSETTAPNDAECWNCGRKAHETCSGCNTARYCSSFCQHKDWEQHHSSCGRSHGERGDRSLSSGAANGQQDSKPMHVQQGPPSDNSNSPINVSHPSPDNRSSGSRSN